MSILGKWKFGPATAVASRAAATPAEQQSKLVERIKQQIKLAKGEKVTNANGDDIRPWHRALPDGSFEAGLFYGTQPLVIDGGQKVKCKTLAQVRDFYNDALKATEAGELGAAITASITDKQQKSAAKKAAKAQVAA